MTYKLEKFREEISCVKKIEGNFIFLIPFIENNTDYAKFKDDILKGNAELQDSEGVVMSPDAAKEFVRILP